MNTHRILFAAALALAAPAAFADGNADNGKQLFEGHGCAGCHGGKGVSNKGQDPQPPILAGQYKDYIIQALHEYQKGERNSVVMKGMAAPLSDQDIKDLAEYLSALPGPLGTLPKGGN
jgi:cytochrome c553